LNIKYVFWFSLRLLCKTFLLKTIKRDIVISVKMSSCKAPVILSDFNQTTTISTNFRKKKEKRSNITFIKIRPGEADLFHANAHDEAHSRFSPNVPKNRNILLICPPKIRKI
jgi:hypothetical protein